MAANLLLESPHVHHNAPPARVPIVSVRDLVVTYNGETALDRVTLDVMPSERVAIIGPNGAGKSTLIKALMGLLRPASGALTLAIPEHHIGYVPQHEDVSWDFPVTVYDVVMMGCARQIGWLRRARREQRERVGQALEKTGMADFATRQVGELSGGQRRRVFIARALAQQAQLLVLDEPFSGVDVRAQGELMDVLDALNRDGLTILLSTHDLDLAFHRFDKVAALRRRLLAYGAPPAVYTTDTLAQLYGQRLVAWHGGQQVEVFVDEHGCC